MKVYGDIQSGNCYKVKLLLAFLGIEHEWCHVNILKGDTKTAEFLSINPNGKIPVVVLDDGCCLSESNAILGYFADGTALIPSNKYEKAKCTNGCSLNNTVMSHLLQWPVLSKNIKVCQSQG
ncbi:glutathione S-transferase [Vibrio mimicus CAIM 602]|nr:glutathione S-transferase [Vibrio mimicus CAIM 602]